MTDEGLWRTTVMYERLLRYAGSPDVSKSYREFKAEVDRRGLEQMRRPKSRLVLDRATCDWVIDRERDTAICRTHGEVADGRDSPHFPGARL
jgi:hypothetical protein